MERNRESLLRIAKEFFNTDNIIDIKKLYGGHINSTYLVVFPECRYILQQLNHHVFTSPFGVMNNMKLVTEHIKKKCIYDGKSRTRAFLNVVPTRYDQYLALVDDEYWRCMEYIEGGVAYESIEKPDLFKEVGKAVGNFHYMLEDFHSRLIDDPIKNFHDTPERYKDFISKLKKYDPEKVKQCKKEIDFIKARKDVMGYIVERLKDTSLKRRVCHNDTKLSNVMIDEKTGKYMCLIDLDTVMRGAIAYDFGDALRFGASTALEDETDLSKVSIDLSLIRKFIEGFLYELRPKNDKYYISQEELKSLYYGYLIITLELGMRFLDDYLDGDKYFHVDENRPEHNLERARNQLKLVSEIEKNKGEIIKILNEVLLDNGFAEDYLIPEE